MRGSRDGQLRRGWTLCVALMIFTFEPQFITEKQLTELSEEVASATVVRRKPHSVFFSRMVRHCLFDVMSDSFS
jgi:hypothetical protein